MATGDIYLGKVYRARAHGDEPSLGAVYRTRREVSDLKAATRGCRPTK
jgi:hypothetical protein